MDNKLLSDDIYANVRKVKAVIPWEVSLVDVPGVPKARFVFRRNAMTIADKLKELKAIIDGLAKKGEATKDDLELLSKKFEDVMSSPQPSNGYEKNAPDGDGEGTDDPKKKDPENPSQGDAMTREISGIKTALEDLQKTVAGIIDILEEI